MPIHPDAQAAMDARDAAGARPTYTLSPDEARAQHNRLMALSGPGEPVARVENREIPGPTGPLTIRIYHPSLTPQLPVLIYYHGGGWVQGNLDTSDNLCRTFANLSQCIVVSCNYRHAPEHKFPAAVEDAYAAAVWIVKNAESFGGDPNKVAVSGTSAGANLMARDRGTPEFKFQVLIVPVTNYGSETASYRADPDKQVLSVAVMNWCWANYLARPEDGANPYASPLRAPDLTGLPPAFVATAEFDPLRDEGQAYALRMQEAGVPIQHRCYEGMVHAYLGPDAYPDAMGAIRRHFGFSVSP
jgi:acetyl esterase